MILDVKYVCSDLHLFFVFAVYHMTKEGHKKVVGADVGSLFYEYSTVLAEPTID